MSIRARLAMLPVLLGAPEPATAVPLLGGLLALAQRRLGGC